DDPLYYDYWHALLARAALWAAGKEGTVRITGLPAAGIVLAQSDLPGRKIDITLTGERQANVQYFLHWVVRDRQNHIEQMDMTPCPGDTATLALPFLKGGEKVLDVWLRDENARVVDWSSVSLDVRPPVAIAGIDFAKEAFGNGEAVTGTVRLSRSLEPGQVLRVMADDCYGRRVAARDVDAAGKTACPFTLAVAHPLSGGLQMTAQVVAGGRTLDENWARFYINITDFAALTGDFTFQITAGSNPRSRNSRTWLRELPRWGIDTAMGAGLYEDAATSRENARLVADSGINVALYATRLVAPSDNGNPDAPSLPAANNPLAKKLDALGNDSIINHLRDLARAYGPVGVVAYSLGDENMLSLNSDIDFSEQSLRDFRTYLQVQYANLEALNREWGTDYQTWDAVRPITFKEAAKLNRYPQWIDHRLHMDRLFTQWHAVCMEAIRQIDPAGKSGAEGLPFTTNSYTGYNLPELLSHFDYYCPYPVLPDIHAFSFLPSQSMRGTWIGSYEGDPDEYAYYMPWNQLFEGGNSISWYASGLGGAYLPGMFGFSPDRLPQPPLRKTAEVIREIKSGVGKLLISAERVAQPIGVYYSNACLHASAVRHPETSWENSLQDFHYVLRDAGYEYRYVTPSQVLGGELRKYKVLVLP
ncbi:MAG TPA: beta-galactosidase, partial [Armatimonadota bacterium]